MSRDQCVAFFSPKYGGTRCPHAGKHRHKTQKGDTLLLCGTHLNMLLTRERQGSGPEVVARWREAG